MLKIREEYTDNDTVTLYLEGRMSLGEGSAIFRDKVKDLMEKGVRKILIDFGETSYVDSSGIGELVSFISHLSNIGGQHAVVNPTKRLADLLHITKLYTCFNMYDDHADAISSFKK